MDLARLDNYLRQSILASFYFLFLATPLIWNPTNSELFELPKMMFVYGMSLVILTLWLARMVSRSQLLIHRNWFNNLLGLFVISQLIATVFSMHTHTSLHGFYTRFHGGLLSTLAYSVLYLAFVSNFRRSEVYRALAVLAVSGLISSLIAFPEHFGYAFSCLFITGSFVANCWQQDIVSRIFGTFGQPNWLAAYVITTTPLVWSLAHVWWDRGKDRSWYAYPMLLTSSLMTATLIFTNSRSGLLGFLLALGLFLVLTSWIYRLNNLKFTGLLLGSTAMVFAIFGSIYSPSLTELLARISPSETVMPATAQAMPETGTVLDRGGTESGEIRRIVWQGGLDIFFNNWLVGTGVETFAYSYYNFRPLAHNLVSEWDFLYNKAHNEFINMAANTGLIGLLAYLSLIGWSYFVLVRQIKPAKKHKQDRTKQQIYIVGLVSGLSGLHISNFFGFSTVGVGLLFFIFPALIVLLMQDKDQTEKPKSTPASPNHYAGLTLVALIGLFSLIQVYRYYQADIVFAQARQAESSNNFLLAIEKYEEAISLQPHQARYFNDYANLLARAAHTLAVEQEHEAAVQLANHAREISYQALQLNPVHLNFYKSQAGVYIRLAALDPEMLGQAAAILETGLYLAPTDAKIAYNLGLIYQDRESTDSALQYLERAVSMKPNYEIARMELGELYEALGRYEDAQRQYQYILNYIAPENTVARERLEELADRM